MSAGKASVGLVGTGWALSVQLPRFKDAGLHVAAISSRSQEKANKLCKEHKIDQGFTDVPSLAAAVDFVSVVSPAYLHKQHSLEALHAGKAVMTNKPFALNTTEARELLKAAKERPKQVTIVDHELRFTPACQACREHVRKGTIGALKAVTIQVCLPGPADAPYSWWNDRAAGGGVWGAVGSHLIDALRFILGAEVQSISACMEVINSPRPDPENGDKPTECTADDMTSASLRMVPASGSGGSWEGAKTPLPVSMTMALVGSVMRPPYFRFAGEKGLIEFNVADTSMSVTDDQNKEVASVKGGGNGFPWGTELEAKAFAKAFGPEKDLSAIEVAATWEDGLKVQLVMDAGWKSHDTGRQWVQVEQA